MLNAGADEEAFFISYCLECTALWCILGLFLAKSSQLRANDRYYISPQSTISFVKSISIVLALSLFDIIKFMSENFNYLGNNSAMMYESNSNAFDKMLGELVFCSNVLLVCSQRRWTPILLFSFLAICVYTAIDVFAGVRFLLLTPIAVLALRYFNKTRLNLKLVSMSAIALFTCVYFVLPVVIAIGNLRQGGKLEFSSISSDSGISAEREKMFGELFTKLDSYSTGAILTSNATGLGMAVAGLKPFWGSALVFVPRFIWPERPIAGSMDGTIYGHPSRVVAQALSSSDSFNVGVSPLHVSFWEFGYLGFPIFVICGVLFLFFIDSTLKRSACFPKVVGIFLLNLPIFAFLLPSPDVMVMRAVVAALFLIAWRVWNLVIRPLNRT